MSGPANMNYDTLCTDVVAYTERGSDTALSTQLPRLVMLAENRIATGLRILGTREVAQSTFTAGNPIVPKPAYWRRTESFNYTDATGQRTQVLPRSIEFCRDYWPNPSTAGAPRYYADYDFDNFLVVGTPSAGFSFEILYIARLAPLSSSQGVNWLTANAPQLLLTATLLEAEIFLKNTARIQVREDAYNKALAGFQAEDATRAVDRNIVLG
jgi:hypothetical protein